MNVMQWLASQPWVERLGWTLVHFLWQGAVIAAIYAAARRAAHDASPHVRYLLACAALLAMVGAPAVTWLSMGPAPPPLAQTAAGSPVFSAVEAPVPDGIKVPVSQAASAEAWATRFPPYVVAAWLAGALAFWVRCMGGWVVAARMRSMLVRPAPAAWQLRASQLAALIGVSRSVRVLVSALVQVPAVVGWLRPVVLLPVGALAGLPAGHVEALLAHELAHIRRHDYLVNMLQGVAEALLFYHPAVWWVSGHMRAEREHCCDDVAVAVGGDVLTYANVLIELESCRAPRSAALVAANHGSLANRVRRLLGESQPSGRAFSGPAIVVTAMFLLAAAWGVFAQSTEAPRFEVASIKPNNDPNPRFWNMRPLPGGRLSAVHASAQMLIQNAYAVQAYQLIGGPHWMTTDGFDIEAKGKPEATREQVLLMLRSLLEDRFQFRFRRETRDLPVYVLTIARSGAKLPTPKEGGCFERNLNTVLPSKPAPGQPSVPCGSTVIGMGPNGSTTMAGGKVPMKEFVRALQMTLRQPVLDRTGRTDPFDVDLKFTRDDTTRGLATPVGGAGPEPAADPLNTPTSIFTALQQQLGLKLEKSKGPVEVLVIDHLERPSAN